MATETIPAEDLEAAKERVKGILGDGLSAGLIPGDSSIGAGLQAHPTATKPKKTRSDAGTKRAPKQEPAKSGVLTGEQAAHLDSLVHAKMRAEEARKVADSDCLYADSQYREYLAELQGK